MRAAATRRWRTTSPARGQGGGLDREEIKAVMDDATSGDYDHLLATMMEHVEEQEDDLGP